MRKDLHQVIVDEPRRGSRWMSTLYKGVRRAKRFKLDNDYEVINDDFGHHVSMKAKKFRLDSKSFGDHVAPLYRSLAAQVGRPWNDVFSELCRYYDRRSMVGLHVHQHLRDRINRNVYFDENGKVCSYSRGRGELAGWRLYVDADGILRRASDINGEGSGWRKYYNERQKTREEERRKVYREIGDLVFELEEVGENHKKYDGRTKAWFKYHWILVKRTRSIQIGTETRFGREVPVYRYEEYLERVKVRDSASKKEIRDYGLNG